ncbi:MAG: hypothetical protein CVU84_12045 [Firmicutes bacterium HGW-Firmicutes-1]|jgi:diguanylate cyclase (GGDEF)-like protein|nr:MAG: hypothetical protein CVU84_12045 [Firmicutes bacterium HGW-Firmicutes-1]
MLISLVFIVYNAGVVYNGKKTNELYVIIFKLKKGYNMFTKINARSLEERLLIYILIFTSILPVFLIVENIIIDFPFIANYKWFSCVLVSGVLLFFALQGKYIFKIQIILVCVAIFGLLPFGWFTAGVSNNFTIAYSFLIFIGISYLFEKKLKIILMISEVLVIIIMMLLNAYHPSLFLVVPLNTQVIDSVVQVVITFAFGALLLGTFSNAYKKEKEVLNKYADLLDLQNKELEKLTMIDDLSQLYNRRYIFNFFNSYQNTPNRQKLLIGMIDIDAFKEINDTYGHDLGDQVIKYISNELKTIVNSNGIVGRYGGDEFIVILENTNPDFYNEIVKQINHILIQIDTITKPITLSGGFVFYDGEDTVDEALYRADVLLYHVKDSGKNNMIIA